MLRTRLTTCRIEEKIKVDVQLRTMWELLDTFCLLNIHNSFVFSYVYIK